VLAKVFSAVLEVISNKADSVKPGSHGELRVFNLWLLAAGALLGQGLMVHCKAQCNVASNLSCVKRSVEAP
jgi:hypothetical protein